MLPAKPVNHRLTALNTAYIISGITGMLYFVYGFAAIRQTPVSSTAVPAEVLKSHHYYLLFVALLEMGMGLYIFQAVKKTFLFLQSLATMLIFTGHGMIIYQFHSETTTGRPDMDMITLAFYVLIPAIVLHAFARMEHRFKRIKVTVI